MEAHKHKVTDIFDFSRLFDSKANKEHSHEIQDIKGIKEYIDVVVTERVTAATNVRLLTQMQERIIQLERDIKEFDSYVSGLGSAIDIRLLTVNEPTVIKVEGTKRPIVYVLRNEGNHKITWEGVIQWLRQGSPNPGMQVVIFIGVESNLRAYNKFFGAYL